MIPISHQDTILPLHLTVTVAGVAMQATVLEDLSDAACYKYRVRFENDTEDIFTLVEGPENYTLCAIQGNNHYAQALTHELYELSKIEPEKFLSVLQMPLHEGTVNLWLSEEEPDPGEKDCVMVSYNGYSGFQLYRVKEGEPWGYRENQPVPLTKEEAALADNLCRTMEKMYATIPLK